MLGSTTRFEVNHASSQGLFEEGGVTLRRYNVSLQEIDVNGEAVMGGENLNLNITRPAGDAGPTIGTIYDATFTEVV